MRVLFWSEMFWPHLGGAELGGLELILSLRQRGHEFIIVTRQDDPSLPAHEEYRGIPIFRFPFWRAFADRNPTQLLKARQEVDKLKRKFAPDLIHIHSLGPSVLFHLETAKAHVAPLLVTLTSHPPELSIGLQLFKRVLGSANWVTAKSTATLSRARQLLPEINHHSSVVYRGVKAPQVTHQEESATFDNILCVGRLSTEKGFDLAIQAFSQVLVHFPQARLIIVGNGPENSSLVKQTQSLGLTEKIVFLGWISPEKLPAILLTATIVMIPSRREALPRVAVEAAFFAKPVVATRVGGMAEVVVHEQTGLLVEPESSQALATGALGLLADPEKASAMGEAARDRAREIFDMNRFINSYQDLYEQLVLVKSA